MLTGVIYIDESGRTLIIQAFNKKLTLTVDAVDVNASSTNCQPVTGVDAEIISILQEQLAVKEKQIDELNARLKETTAALEHTTASLHAAQALHAGTMQTQILTDNKLEDKPEKKTFLQRIFSKRNSVH